MHRCSVHPLDGRSVVCLRMGFGDAYSCGRRGRRPLWIVISVGCAMVWGPSIIDRDSDRVVVVCTPTQEGRRPRRPEMP